MSSSRPTVLICVGVYLPGYRGGGPIRSLSNLVDNLSDSFEFKVLTLDHDVGVDSPYSEIEYGQWQPVGRALVRYLSRKERVLPGAVGTVNRTPSSAVYLNAVWPTPVSTPVLVARRLGLLRDVPIVVCPRGHLTPGSLRQKPTRKRVYLRIAQAMGLYQDVFWHAASEREASNIRTHFGADARIRIAPNLGVSPSDTSTLDGGKNAKKAGRLRVVFLSRISPIKNLFHAIRYMQGTTGDVVFNIYGPIKDQEYWCSCQAEIAKLPESVNVEYHGAVSHERVFEIFREHDLFLFPTHGENFGHVIFEALASGCPVLTSDQTPWRNLTEVKAGWDIPLDAPHEFQKVLQWCVDASEEDYRHLREGARRLAGRATASPENVAKVRELFEWAIAEG